MRVYATLAIYKCRNEHKNLSSWRYQTQLRIINTDTVPLPLYAGGEEKRAQLDKQNDVYPDRSSLARYIS